MAKKTTPAAAKKPAPKHNRARMHVVAVVSGTALPLLLVAVVGWRTGWFRRRR